MSTNTLREEFEAAVPIRETEERSYYSYRDAKRSTVPAKWEWQENAPNGAWHTGFESREAAFVDAVHALLCKAQEYGQPEHYARLMLLAWTLPLPLKYLQAWEEFRPAPKQVSPKIPDACRAPAQALAWGMPADLVATAPARREIADWTTGYERYASDKARQLRSRHGTYGEWLYRAQLGRLDGHYASSMQADLSRVLDKIRRAGLAESFGVWTEPTGFGTDAQAGTVHPEC